MSSWGTARVSGCERESRIVLACIRPLRDPGRIDAIRDATAAAFRGDALAALAHRHRVEGFVQQGLAAAGISLAPTDAARLASGAAAARLQSLRNAGEEVRVGRALAAAGVDALFVKGATLGALVHPEPGIKTSWDIDVLVARERLDAAGHELEQLGYRLRILDGITDPAKIRRYITAHKESEWHHRERGTVVELHSALSDNNAAIAAVGLASPRQSVELMAGTRLQTLAPAPLFAYLAYHGSSHLWARLKWLADVGALLHGSDVGTLHDEAVALGAGRAPGVAILLAHALLDVPAPEPLLARLRRDRGVRRLLRYSHAAIAAPQDVDGRLARPLRELAAFARAQAWLVPGWRHRWGAARRFLTRPYLPAHLIVPGWAVPLVIVGALPLRLLLRPWRLRRERQAGGKVASRP